MIVFMNDDPSNVLNFKGVSTAKCSRIPGVGIRFVCLKKTEEKNLLTILFPDFLSHSGSFMDGKMAVTQREDSPHSDDKQGVFHSTPDPGRELPQLTTAPPFTDLNHQHQLKTISQPDPHYQSQERFKGSREVDHHLFKALSAQLVSHEDEGLFSDVTPGAFSVHTGELTAGNLERSEAAGKIHRESLEELSTEALTTRIMPTSAPPPCRTVPHAALHAAATQEPEGVTTLRDERLMTREEDEKSKRHMGLTPDANKVALSVSGDQDDETTTTTIFTTTIITTIQTPGNTTCTITAQQNLINMPGLNMPLTNCSVVQK